MDPVWLLLGLAVLAVSAVFFVMLFKYRIKKRAKRQPVPKPPAKIGESAAKKKALDSIDHIIFDVTHKKIDIRESYQQLSMVMRVFMTEISGTDVMSLTLYEMKNMKLGKFPELVEKWYEPEFAMMTRANFMQDAERAKKLVNKWN